MSSSEPCVYDQFNIIQRLQFTDVRTTKHNSKIVYLRDTAAPGKIKGPVVQYNKAGEKLFIPFDVRPSPNGRPSLDLRVGAESDLASVMTKWDEYIVAYAVEHAQQWFGHSDIDRIRREYNPLLKPSKDRPDQRKFDPLTRVKLDQSTQVWKTVGTSGTDPSQPKVARASVDDIGIRSEAVVQATFNNVYFMASGWGVSMLAHKVLVYPDDDADNGFNFSGFTPELVHRDVEMSEIAPGGATNTQCSSGMDVNPGSATLDKAAAPWPPALTS